MPGVLYPASIDTFTVPSAPATTSLSSSGSSDRDHVESHRDHGLAITAIETNAALKTHDHSGVDDRFHGPKLTQSVTHQSPDTDAGPTSLHHTLGTSANQAAAGNHTHDYNGASILNKPYLLCTSSTRPASPYIGLTIFETDTLRERVWAQFPGQIAPGWQLKPTASIPFVRLRQATAQTINPAGSVVEWGIETEDNFGFYNSSSSLTNIVMREAGLYQIDAAIQWNPSLVSDTATVVLCVDGVETMVRTSMPLRGGVLFDPGFSQTVPVSGKIRVTANQILTFKASYVLNSGIIDWFLSFFDGPNKIASRIDVAFLGP